MQTTTETEINLTEKAAEQIKLLRDGSDDTKGKPLRLYVEAGGCSGFQYGMAFDQRQPDDVSVTTHDVELVVDPNSAEKLRGVTIDYEDSLQSTGFKIINPNAQRSCGCGKSFEA